MSIGVEDLHRIINASVHDMLDAYRIQAQTGPVTEHAIEGIIYRGAHPIVRKLAPRAAEERGALLPSVVRMLLASFLEAAGVDGATPGSRGGEKGSPLTGV